MYLRTLHIIHNVYFLKFYFSLILTVVKLVTHRQYQIDREMSYFTPLILQSVFHPTTYFV